MARRSETPAFETKSEWAYRRLRRMIADGELAAGSRLVLRQLASDFGLSEMPVREALRMLQRDGLVEFESHRGATVVAISGEEVIEGISVRMWLEVLAVMQAAERRTDAALQAARKALADTEAAMRGDDPARFSTANRRFHEALESPADELVRATVEELWNRVWQARRSFSLFLLKPEQMRKARSEHAALLAAVERSDAEAARAAMEEHRTSSLAAWRAALERVPDKAPHADARRASARPR
jgi:DNA-binding GntR family transcriptional regulator